MKQDTMPEIEQMFQLATQFFNQADAFCKKNKGMEEQIKSLTQEVEDKASIVRWMEHQQEELQATVKSTIEACERVKKENEEQAKEIKALQEAVLGFQAAVLEPQPDKERVEELETTINDLRKQLEQGENGCYWISVDDDRKPLDFEMVVVETKSGVRYMQTYCNGFTSDVEYWMSLPENTNRKGGA